MNNKYLRLMRVDKPAGIALLWAPTAWALWLANHGAPAGWLLGYFLLGTVCMRTAGCIINDLADKNIDKHVQRTCLRPLTQGEVSVPQALVVLGLLLVVAGLVALQLPKLCWIEAIAALAITSVYPFAKRWFQAPQLLLGIAFSMGIPMAYAASRVPPNRAMVVLSLINFLWIVAYDTMYALVDREDDLKIGVRSTAILFGTKAVTIILLLLGIGHGLWAVLAWFYPFALWFWLGWAAAAGILVYQGKLLRTSSTVDAMRAFLWTAVYGLLMWAAVGASC